ncbi:biotin-(acetyl-CoA carboxylase) ligase (macronuclear) [Tetrahymena thermophila SB210]|uniref:Biotin-(Acetyl-CoA carboxylase) ligase n=1 Tax=Tetrahymena thermophila (strain SB210) TaxID=312017 RepID=Q22XR5_TETTS|nr:biotin-(acetyl-CoA carboxylase) ligase [Tetrahymena thermophila SB210]EAR90106.1 biotin-(acetyl-CoA carboxylase) ligase [Tetrahymena thermophila SB210]|eukprot:XP_001010351.1 biotin-(acetyl-CoA carboxylase) ligase [Tetrahymena thermophila SB210]
MNKEAFKVKKICYLAFKRAADGDMNEVKNLIDIFQKQRMIILSKIPGCSQLRKEVCHIAMQLNSQHTENKKYFSVGTNSYNGMISHMNNYFNIPQVIEKAQSLGYQKNDSPDLLIRAQNPEIQNFNDMEKKFIDFSRSIFLEFFKIVDYYLRNDIQQQKIHDQNQCLEHYVKSSEVQKYRNIILLPSQDQYETAAIDEQNQIQVPWHFDVSMATLLLKEMYIVKEQSSQYCYKEIPQPDCGAGLVIRDAYGSDHVVSIEDDEVIIQGGISLQILSNDILKAQAHCVRKPKDRAIGRISNTTFFYPPFDTKMETNDQKQTIEIQASDMNVIDKIIKFSNHWRQGVQWIEFHHNQMLQHLLKAFVIQQQKKYNISEEIQINYHSVQVPQGQVKIYQFNQIDSTMDVAKFWCKHYVSDKYSFGFVADQQSNGKGQNQNSWLSPKGNCYVTFLIKFESELSYCISQLTALSVLETIEQFIVKNQGSSQNKIICPQLKWINDIYINEKKVSGVLCTSDGDYLSIGIGVNLNQNPFLDTATSLKKELQLDGDINVLDFIQNLSYNLMANLQEVRNARSYEKQIVKIIQKLMYINQRVIIYDETLTIKLQEGIFVGLNKYGNAILQDGDKQTTVIHGRMRKTLT